MAQSGRRQLALLCHDDAGPNRSLAAAKV